VLALLSLDEEAGLLSFDPPPESDLASDFESPLDSDLESAFDSESPPNEPLPDESLPEA
jgi:hypothetical protein